MSGAEERNARLSRASILAAAGGTLIGLSQQAPDLALGLTGKVMIGVGAVLVVGGLVAVIGAFVRR